MRVFRKSIAASTPTSATANGGAALATANLSAASSATQLNSSEPSAAAYGSHALSSQTALFFVSSALERLLATKETKRVSRLRESAEAALARIRNDTAAAATSVAASTASDIEGSSNVSPATQSGAGIDPRLIDTILDVFDIACSSKFSNLQIIALDCIAKTIPYGLFKLSPPPSLGSSVKPQTPTSHVDDAQGSKESTESTSSPAEKRSSLTEDELPSPSDEPGNEDEWDSTAALKRAIDVICRCNSGEATEDTVHLQIIKALLSAITSAQPQIHGNLLLHVVRCTWNVFLATRSHQISAIAHGSLNQIINGIFQAAVNAGDNASNSSSDGSASTSSTLAHPVTPAATVTFSNTESQKIPSRIELPLSPTLTEASSSGPSPIDMLEHCDPEAAVAQSPASESDAFIIDAFLIFRAICRLSTKSVNESGPASPEAKTASINSRVLALQLINLALSKYSSLFFFPLNAAALTNDPSSLLSTSSAQRTHGAVPMIDFVRQMLATAVASAIASPILSVSTAGLDIFARMVLGFRSKFKREIEVIMSEIVLCVLDMRTAAAAHRLAILRCLALLGENPQVIVELYLNYDCNPDAADSLFERMIGVISKLSSANPASLIDYNADGSQQKTTPLSISSFNTGPSGNSISGPIHSQSQNHQHNASTPQGQNELLRAALDCLGRIIGTLATWVASNRSNQVAGTSLVGDSSSHSSADTAPSTATENGSGGEDTAHVHPTPLDEIDQSKQKKALISEAVARFNKNPKKGIKYLFEQKAIPESSEALAVWLTSTPGISKLTLGEFLGDADEFAAATMHCFVDLLDFSNTDVIDALRSYLQQFRLPGEAQKIDRLIIKFAERYYTCCKESKNENVFASADAIYLLAFGVVMLNVDLHSPQVKNRMTVDDFIKNITSTADNHNLPRELLESVYKSIQSKEIILSNDPLAKRSEFAKSATAVSKRARGEVYASALEDILQRIDALFTFKRKYSQRWFSATHTEHVSGMVEQVWMPLLAALSTAMQRYDDESYIFITITCLKNLIGLCCTFDLDLQRSTLLTTLKNFTMLGNANEMRTKNFSSIRVLFEIALAHGDRLRKGWLDVFKCISQLEQIKALTSQKSGIEASMQQETASQAIVVLTDKIFSTSPRLGGAGIVDFVEALCMASWDEIPRRDLLTRLVEISFYNMQRIRVEWVNIWGFIGSHFHRVGCHPNDQMAFFALDSLRQMAMKFLQKEELSNYRFQRDFLRPFETIVDSNSSTVVREMAVRCVQYIVQSKASMLRSGWKSIPCVLATIARQEGTGQLFEFTFDCLRTIEAQHAALVMQHGCLVDLLDAELAFMESRLSQKISLQAVEMLKRAADMVLAVDPVDEVHSFSLFFVFLKAINRCELEVRTRALHHLFVAIKEHGHRFSKQFWIRITTDILFELFRSIDDQQQQRNKGNLVSPGPGAALTNSSSGPFTSDERGIRLSSSILPDAEERSEELGVWLSTTLTQALRQFLDIFVAHFSKLRDIFPQLLARLEACVLQENEMLTQLGTSCLQRLVTLSACQFEEPEWSLLGQTWSRLTFSTNRPPPLLVHLVPALDEIMRDPSLQANAPLEFKLEIADIANSLHQQAFQLRDVQNATLAASAAISLWLRLLRDLNPNDENRKAERAKSFERAVSVSKETLKRYSEVPEAQMDINSAGYWRVLVVAVLNGVLAIKDPEFSEPARALYDSIVLIMCHDIANTEVRRLLREFFMRTK